MQSAVSIFDNLFQLNPVRKTLMISFSLEDHYTGVASIQEKKIYLLSPCSHQ
jgi:hypothetical protein